MPLPPKNSKSQQLIAAARRGDVVRVRALLKKGADPDGADLNGTTPLHAAVAAEHLAVVKVLVEDADADINAVDKKGRTPYDIACEFDMSQHPPKTFFYLNGKGAKNGWQMKKESKKKKAAAKKKAAKASDGKTASGNGPSFSGGSEGANAPAEPPRKKEPKFTEERLTDIFNPGTWVGKTEEMEKLWEEVPKKLQSKFDFVAALSEAKRQSMRKNFAAPRFKPKL